MEISPEKLFGAAFAAALAVVAYGTALELYPEIKAKAEKRVRKELSSAGSKPQSQEQSASAPEV